jgi:hypothetical protein
VTPTLSHAPFSANPHSFWQPSLMVATTSVKLAAVAVISENQLPEMATGVAVSLFLYSGDILVTFFDRWAAPLGPRPRDGELVELKRSWDSQEVFYLQLNYCL